jgi:hypothetical protein
MADTNSVFDALVQQLSDDERKHLLERISEKVRITLPPVNDGSDNDTEGTDPVEVYAGSGLFTRLWLFIKALFTGKDRSELVREMMIQSLGRSVVKQTPGLIDPKNGRFLTLFRDQLQGVAECCRVFQTPLSRVSGSSESGFLAFLTGMEMETLHQQILTETDPFTVSSTEPELTEPEVKRRLYLNLEFLLESMSADLRSRMYNNSRFIRHLYALSVFPFDSMLNCFVPLDDEKRVGCAFYELKDQVVRLARVLESMRFAPSERLFESLFLYANQYRLSDPEYDMENELKRFIHRASEAMDGIKNFYHKVPLLRIARYVSGNLYLETGEISGGEDWFVLLKRFWSDRIERLHESFLFSVKKQNTLGELGDLMGRVIRPIENYPAHASHTEGSHAASLGVIKAYFDSVFASEHIPPLKNLLIDGEFYKDDNRREFDTAFQGLLEIPGTIRAFEARLSDTGDLGMEYAQADRQSGNSSARGSQSAKLKEEIIARVDEIARSICLDTLREIRSVSDVLNGVLYGEVGGRYDTIANLGQIGGRSNKDIKRRLDEALRSLNRFREALQELFELEEKALSRGL